MSSPPLIALFVKGPNSCLIAIPSVELPDTPRCLFEHGVLLGEAEPA
jgi:hypothetical protein